MLKRTKGLTDWSQWRNPGRLPERGGTWDNNMETESFNNRRVEIFFQTIEAGKGRA